MPASLSAQIIHGTVKDEKTNQPLAFATIKIGNAGQGVIADLNGVFTIELNREDDEIEVSYLGYESAKRTVNRHSTNLTIFLKQATSVFKELVIKSPDDKIRRILNRAIDHRNDHNPEKYDWYRCHIYYKMLADVALPDSVLNSDSAKDVKAFIEAQHLLMSETYSIRTWKKPQKLQEEIIGSRFSGFKKSLFNGLVTDVLPFHAYTDYLKLNGKDYHNPVSKGYGARYYFSLSDEFMQGNDTTWLLSFKPRKGMEGMTGKVWISSDGYPITHITATAFDSNLKREVRLEQQYTKVGTHWFPNQLNYIFNWEVKNDTVNTMVLMKGTSLVDSVSFEPRPSFRFDKVHTTKLLPGADELSDEAWRKLRLAPLDGREQRTYVFMDSLVDGTGIGKYIPYLDKLIQLKIPYKFIDFDLKRLVRNNAFEKYRVGLGVQTNEKVVKWASIGGWAGYGTGDKQWKYGGFLEFYLDQYKETVLSLRYDHDLRDPGRLELHPDLNKNFLRSWLMQRADELTTYSISFRKPIDYWQFKIEAKYEDIKPQYSYFLRSENGSDIQNFTATEASLSLRYAYAERSAPLFGRYYKTATRYPILYGRITTGHLSGNDDYGNNYTQLIGAISWQKHINRIGNENFLAMAGKSWGDQTLPISKLFSGNGLRRDDDYNLYSFGTLITATPYALYSDAFAAFYWKHDFDWKLFHYHPKKGKFGSAPYISLAHNILYGTMKDRYAQLAVTFSVPSGSYNETGIILNNLIRWEYLGLYYITINGGYFYHWTNTTWNSKNGTVVFGLGLEI